MDLVAGQAGVGVLNDFNTGAGSWSLFSTAGAVVFGGQFSGLSAIYIVDPAAAGGTSFGNWWDDIEVEAAVPEPASVILLGSGLAALGLGRRKRAS